MSKLDRRKALIGLGGGAALVLGAGGLWGVTRAPAQARAPWRAAREYPAEADGRLAAFAHAILAPNAYNLQPWKIRLDGDDGATLFCDLDRRAPAADPFDRQITISFGAFLELTRIAAAERGLLLQITSFPEGPALPRLDERPIASMRFEAGKSVEKSPLFDAILQRRTNRSRFDLDEQLTTPDLDAFRALGSETALIEALAVRDRVSALRTIAVDAIIQENATPAVLAEQIKWMRIGRKEIDATPDGIALSGAGVEAAQAFGALSREMLGKTNSAASRQSIDLQTDCAASAMAFVWIVTPSNAREDQLAAGAAYARLDLAAAARGIAIQPLSQALEEYPEMAGPRAALNAALKPPEGARIQMLARLGKATLPPPAPRWPLGDKLIKN